MPSTVAISPMIASTAAGAAAVIGASLLARGMFSPRSSLLIPTVWRGPVILGGPGRIALTFDDGPWPGSTEPILEILQSAGARATFFVIGRYALSHPDLIRRIQGEGHLIGNHTFDHHRTGLFRGSRYWTEQIARTDDAAGSITGEAPLLFRPPMGFKSPTQARAVRRQGHTVVAWSRRGWDGVTTRAEEIVRAVANVKSGDIVLLHDGRDPASTRQIGATAEALPAILRTVREAGLAAVRVDDMIGRVVRADLVSGRAASR